MEKEFIKNTERTITLNVTAGKIDSFREIERTTGTVRVYENGCIGVAGCLGEPDEEALTARAIEALDFGIPYPEKLEGPLEMKVLNDEEIIPIPEFIPKMQHMLDRLGELCPRFAISHKISLVYNRTEYTNSKGRRLVNSGRLLSVQLLGQNRGSGNLYDTGFFYAGENFDEEKLLREFKREYDAFYRTADIEPGRYPVVAEPAVIIGHYMQHFIGDLYAAGASLISGKLGEKLFSDKLTVRDDRNPATAHAVCFFDTEGCIADEFRPALIENGVIKGLLTTKKTAEAYGLTNFGSAEAAYDGVPNVGLGELYLEPTAKRLAELVPGKAILVVIASGGDVTPDGRFATPVQMAYLMENGELVGRLPEITVAGNFLDVLGKDYVGSVHGDPMEGYNFSAFVMDVDKVR